MVGMTTPFGERVALRPQSRPDPRRGPPAIQDDDRVAAGVLARTKCMERHGGWNREVRTQRVTEFLEHRSVGPRSRNEDDGTVDAAVALLEHDPPIHVLRVP
jgi:hypothetical protein